MSDIVERLCKPMINYDQGSTERDEAAAEIERLRTMIEDDVVTYRKLMTEIEQLRAALQRIVERPNDLPLRTRNEYEAGEKQAMLWAADIAIDALAASEGKK